ncbi:histidine phosphatase family protein [Roseateles paludis]|uniref:Histidine phosphatase family protein n=1 Tax=Roseateles paludis TaxID=3145238 RepID=A0ABV0G277_9BURK
MGMLFLVRHGQAQLGAADYDQLSPLGLQQCQRLGRYWRDRGQRFDAVFTGTLKRHAQSLQALGEGLGQPLAAQQLPGLDEYDSQALVRGLDAGPQPALDAPSAVRQHFRLLRQALRAWVQGEIAPAGMPTHAEFAAGVRSALAQAHALGPGRQVLIVSSGGPIATAVCQVLGAPAASFVDLNLRLRNASLTQFVSTAAGYQLQEFNTLPHLDDAAGQLLVSYA